MGKFGPSATHGGYVGGREQPLHYIWRSIMARCYRPKCKDYPRYGGRGIRVCEEWHTYENFVLAMGTRPTPKHSVERDDVNGPYSPHNCRWATASEQQRNTTRTKLYQKDGDIGTLIEWATALGISKELAHWRFKTWGTFEKGKVWQLLPRNV